MLFVGERIDDMHPLRRSRECVDLVLRVGADDECVHPALEVAGHVFERFTRPCRELRGHIHRRRAQLPRGDLERRSRPERGFLEEQRDVQAGQRVG
jgi:hypothetical protein